MKHDSGAKKLFGLSKIPGEGFDLTIRKQIDKLWV